jgi:ribosome hibernation promoting factor
MKATQRATRSRVQSAFQGILEESMMIPIEVRSNSADRENEIRQFAERRISFALDHLRSLRRIVISIDDVNGPKGGVDKHCRIVAEFGFTSIVIEETQPLWQIAIARAIHRVARKAAQKLQQANRSSAQRSRRTSPASSRSQRHTVRGSLNQEDSLGSI